MSEAAVAILKAVSKSSRITLRNLARSLLTIVCAIQLHGCVAIPVPLALADPEPFTAERMRPIRIGQTTRDEVRALFANWNHQTDHGSQVAHLEPQIVEGGRYWVFNLRRQTGDIAWAGVFLNPESPYPAPFFAGKADNYQDYWALFEFNDESTVARFWIASDKSPCAVGGACYHDGFLQIIADATPGARSQAGKPGSDRCVLYIYAEDDFELPVTATDGRDVRWLFGETSFARFDVARGAASASAWYESIEGSSVPMPFQCMGGESHYLALRPNKGLIEVKQQTVSTGAGAVKGRYLVEHLVPAPASVASKRPGIIWTNCTAANPCHEMAALDLDRSINRVMFIGLSMIVDSEKQFQEEENHPSHLLLRPGLYTMATITQDSYRRKRVDTFDLKAGHRYQPRSMRVECGNHWLNSTPREVKAQFCANGEGDGIDKSTNWFEDRATKRVVAGQKWCASDPECPESQCSKQEGQARGICRIPELQCTDNESCEPRQ